MIQNNACSYRVSDSISTHARVPNCAYTLCNNVDHNNITMHDEIATENYNSVLYVLYIIYLKFR